MEDLLASIRKAINEDIGPAPAAGKSQPADPRAAAAAPAEEQSATATEIQQLREKITRSRSGEPASPRDPAQRAASLAAALRSQTPRRAWRDLEPMPAPPPPAPPTPRLRASIVESETPRPPLRPEPGLRTSQRLAPERQPPAWNGEDSGASAPRSPTRAARSDEAPILSGAPAQAVQSAFGRLAETVVARAIDERSIEEMTRELLKVMLKQWLDDNLPGLVERLVREEIQRVARTGR
jgi:cell pole-organizing protein PopZ